MTDIPDFPLKTFFMRSEAGQAEGNLSASYAEPLSLAELLALEAGAEEALREIGLGYPGLYGSVELREQVAARYAGLDAEQVILTSGTDDAIGTLFLALVEPGRRVVVQSPCYTSLASVAAWRGAEVVPWQAREDDGWAPDLDELDGLLEGAALLVVNLPHNPTGFVPDEAWLDRLCEIAAAHGVILVADEIYYGLPYDGGVGSRVLGRYDRAVSLSGMSKTFGLPGLRCGWLASTDPGILQAVRRIRLHFNGMLARPTEFLAALALRHETAVLQRNTAIMREGFAVLEAFMARHANLMAWTPPRAGVNAYVRWLGPGGTDELSDTLFAQQKVLLAPSSRFEAGDRHMRLGFGVRDLARDLERLDSLLAARFAAQAEFERGGDVSESIEIHPDVFRDLHKITAATVNMQLLKRGIRNSWMVGPKPLWDGLPRIVGEAFTFRFVPMREDLATLESYARDGSIRDAIESVPAGKLVVIDTHGVSGAGTLGDILVARLKARGCMGVISDGPMRDVEGVRGVGLPVYCAGSAAPPSITKLYFAGWQEVIGCGGVAVRPDDIVVADEDGAVAVPRELAAEVARDGLEQERFERYAQMLVAGGSPVKGVYPPSEKTQADYEAWVAAGEPVS